MESSNQPNPSAGQMFELNLYLQCVHRSYRHKDNFKLHRNQKDAGKFNDLVFEFQENGAPVYRLLQTSHFMYPKKKRISEQILFSDYSAFNLVENLQLYFVIKQKYKTIGQIKDIIICTNSFLDERLRNEINEITEEDEILDVEVGGSKAKKFHIKATSIILSRIKKEWDIRMEKWKSDKRESKLSWQPALTDEEIVDYLNHLTFVSGIPDVNELSVILENEIGEEFDVMARKDIFNRAFQRMATWIRGAGRRDFFTREDAEALFDEVKAGFELPRDVRYNAQPPVKRFIGRTEQLENMHKLLQSENRVLICGLGGVGKSELVRKYIEKHGQDYDNNILWINAENEEALAKSFHDLATKKLGFKTKNTNHEEVEIRILIQKSYEWFKQSKSLFIFDNANWQQYPPYIRPFLSKKINDPYIIITSRKKWKNDNIVKHIELNVFTEIEATDFISNSLPGILDDQQTDSIGKLAEILQYLPLALSQAIAYITAKFEHDPDTYQITEYIENFSRKSVKYLDYDSSNYCENGYTKTVWTTWNITVEALKRKEAFTLNVLNCMSFLLPVNIHTEFLLKFLKSKEKLKKAVRLLNEYSLITAREKVYSVHRLVQLVTREKLERIEKRVVLVKILEAVVEDDVIISRSVDHCISVWTHFKEICSDLILKYYRIPAIIALILFNGERYEEAYVYGVEALKLISSMSFTDEKGERYIQNIAPIIVFKMLRNGDYEEAQELLEIHRALQHGFGSLQFDDYHKNLREKLSRDRVFDASSKLKTSQESLSEKDDFNYRERCDCGISGEYIMKHHANEMLEQTIEFIRIGNFWNVVQSGSLEHLNKLIQERVNAKSEKGWAKRFHKAASAGDKRIVEHYLLQRGAEEFKKRALQAAVTNHYFTVAKVLLDLNSDESEMPITVKNNAQCSTDVYAQSKGIGCFQLEEKAVIQGPANQSESSGRLSSILARNLLQLLLKIAERYENNQKSL